MGYAPVVLQFSHDDVTYVYDDVTYVYDAPIVLQFSHDDVTYVYEDVTYAPIVLQFSGGDFRLAFQRVYVGNVALVEASARVLLISLRCKPVSIIVPHIVISIERVYV